MRYKIITSFTSYHRKKILQAENSIQVNNKRWTQKQFVEGMKK